MRRYMIVIMVLVGTSVTLDLRVTTSGGVVSEQEPIAVLYGDGTPYVLE